MKAAQLVRRYCFGQVSPEGILVEEGDREEQTEKYRRLGELREELGDLNPRIAINAPHQPSRSVLSCQCAIHPRLRDPILMSALLDLAMTEIWVREYPKMETPRNALRIARQNVKACWEITRNRRSEIDY